VSLFLATEVLVFVGSVSKQRLASAERDNTLPRSWCNGATCHV